jgi:aminoglycoside N3'-acetyltransferase
MIEEINKILKNSKIYNAKYVYIYSDFRSIFQIEKKNPTLFIDKFLNLFLKKNITCIIPAFTYNIKKDFNIDTTQSKVGFLGNYVLKNFKHTRSIHPLFSFIAVGKNSNILKKISKSAFDKNSVHGKLYKKNCYFLNLCRPLNQGNTLVHHIEHLNKAKYRFNKVFETKVFIKKKLIGSNYSAFLRKNLNDKKSIFSFSKVIKKIRKKNYFFDYKVNNLEILIYKYDKFYDDLNSLYKQDNKIFLKYK